MGYTLLQCQIDYLKSLRRKGKPVTTASYSFRLFSGFKGADFEVEKLKRIDFVNYADSRYAAGIAQPSVRRELTLVMAGIRDAKKYEQIAIVPSCELPSGDGMKRRPLEEEEYQTIIRLIEHKPDNAHKRLHKFYQLTYWTGVRSRAAEELKWDRVDFERRIINFNPEGRKVTPTKRRVDCFPIPDEFYPILVQWKAEAKDDYVIGLGPRGRCTTTYHHAHHVVRVMAGLTDPKLAPRHCMRSMYATDLFDKGADPEFVGGLTGDNPAMLRKKYVVIKAKRLRETAGMRGAQA